MLQPLRPGLSLELLVISKMTAPHPLLASTSARLGLQGPLESPSWVGRGGLPQGRVLRGPENERFV